MGCKANGWRRSLHSPRSGPSDGGDDGDGGRIFGRVQAPIPSRPGIKYPVLVPPLTPTITCVDKIMIFEQT